MRNHAPCKGIDACRKCARFRDSVQFCSDLVDLVVCVGRHGGGGHRLTLAGERFVGRLTEDIAEVGDRGVGLEKGRTKSEDYVRNRRERCYLRLLASAGGTRSAASDGGKTRPKIE